MKAPYQGGGNIADTMECLLTSDSNQPKVIDLQQRRNDFDRNGVNYDYTLRLSYKVSQSKIYLSFAHKMNLADNDNKEYNSTYYKYFNDEAENSTRLNRLLDKSSNNMSQGVMGQVMKYFDVKGFKRICLYTEYNYNRNKSTNDERGYLLDLGRATEQSVIDDETTRHWKSWTNHHSVRESFSAGKGIYGFQLDATYNYRHDEMDYTKRNMPALSPQKDYHYLSLHTSFRIRSEKTGALFAQYDISPNIPDIHLFVTYPDMADPQYIILGNDALDMGLEHILTTWYSRNFTKENEKGKIIRTLSAHIAFFHRNNDVTNFTTYDRNTGTITVKPVNVSGNWDGKANIGFTTPFDVAQRFWFETFAKASVLRTQTYSGVVTADNTEQQFYDNRRYTYTASVKPRLKLAPADLSVAYELKLEDNQGTYASANNKMQWEHHVQGKLNLDIPWVP